MNIIKRIINYFFPLREEEKGDIVVIITNDHFKRATDFFDNVTCPLAIALRDMYPDLLIHVMFSTAKIGVVTYRIPVQLWGMGKYDARIIEDMIARAKAGAEPYRNIKLILKRKN